MATSEDRLREEITLVSPSGKEFTANWIGDPITYTNKTSTHPIPGKNGVKIQAQGTGATRYPTTVYFNGPNNDLLATNFLQVLSAESTDNWTIQHPVKGPIAVIWTDAVEQVQPVTSGNVTTVTINFIGNLPDTEVETPAEIQQAAVQSSIQANETAAEQFKNSAKQDTSSARQAIISGIGKVITAVNKGLSIVENFVIFPEIQAIISAIETTLDDPTIDTELLAAQTQSLIQTYVGGQTNAIDALKMFGDFASDIVQVVPDTVTNAGLSTIACTELAVTSALTAMGLSSLIGGITSRPEAVTAAQAVSDKFEEMTTALNQIDILYENETIDVRYFSQSQSYADNLILSGQAITFLLTSVFGLPAERRIVLKERECTPQIAKNEYGSIGNETSETFYIDLLLESNQLCCDDIYFLEAGRVVLIYQ